jgi:predicted ATPase
MMGQIQEGIRHMRQGMAAVQSKGERCYMAGTLRTLAKALAEIGHLEQGMTTLAEAFNLVEETDERHWDAELHRIQAELLLMRGDETEAEASFEKAIQVARQQSAKSWELRAANGLACLWQEQGKPEEARQILAEVYNWFTEGFDTPDLQEAKALLEELA